MKLDQNTLGYTKFEKARIIGSRALQISMGAPFLVKLNEKKLEEIKYNPVEIAKLEWDEGVIPIEVRRIKPPKMGNSESPEKDVKKAEKDSD